MAGDGKHHPRRTDDGNVDRAHQARLLQAGRLLAGVVHEIRNPLTVIEGYAQLLHDRCTEEADREDLAAILREVRRMGTLVEDMLAFARRGSEEAERVDLGQVVSSALNLCVHEMSRAGVSVVAPLPREPLLVRAHRGVCVQVLLNLLINARQSLEAVPLGRRGITIRAEEGAPGRLRLRVSNNGPPIPPEIAEAIFDPFFTTREDGSGTGLGLALCRELLSRYEAEITLEPPEDGTGASFCLDFPRA